MPRQHADYLGQDYETVKERVAAATPLRRVGTPEEAAAVIAFLCSEDASYLSCEIVWISGGGESR